MLAYLLQLLLLLPLLKLAGNKHVLARRWESGHMQHSGMRREPVRAHTASRAAVHPRNAQESCGCCCCSPYVALQAYIIILHAAVRIR